MLLETRDPLPRPGFPHGVRIESVPCPLGCPPNDVLVLTGHDRITKTPGTYSVVRCRSCGLMRTNPRPTPDSMGVFYPDDYAPYQSTKPQSAPTKAPPPAGFVRRQLRRFFAYHNHDLPPVSPGHLLEIGCGSGSFLHEMARQGWTVEGIEFSESAARVARSAGYTVRAGSVETAQPPEQRPDLIVGWMVLEHLHNPVATLRTLRQWVKPGGWLAVSVPDFSALERRLFGDAWFALQLPTHLFHYTPDSIRKVMSAAGWDVERIIWHDNPANLFKSIGHLCEDRGWTKAATFCQQVGDGKRLGRPRQLLGKLLGATHQSGRMTVHAKAIMPA